MSQPSVAELPSLKHLTNPHNRYFARIEGLVGILGSAAHHTIIKVIANFSGCIHLRHSYGLGGTAFSLSMLWVQALPFVALQYYEGDDAEAIKIFLVCSFCLWLILIISFFCTIDLDFMGTFFGTITAAQYTVELFQNATDDAMKFDAAFTNRISYTKPIHGEIKEWVRLNIDRWRLEAPEWFIVELVPDEFLPVEVFEAEGGERRRRKSSVSMRGNGGVGYKSSIGI